MESAVPIRKPTCYSVKSVKKCSTKIFEKGEEQGALQVPQGLEGAVECFILQPSALRPTPSHRHFIHTRAMVQGVAKSNVHGVGTAGCSTAGYLTRSGTFQAFLLRLLHPECLTAMVILSYYPWGLPLNATSSRRPSLTTYPRPSCFFPSKHYLFPHS